MPKPTPRPWLFLSFALFACTTRSTETDSDDPIGKSGNPPPPPSGVVTEQALTTDDPLKHLGDPKEMFKGLTKAKFAGGMRPMASSWATLQKFDTPVKNQGSRGWCTSFAQVAALENLINQGWAEALDLSEINHWYHYQQYSVYASANAAKAKKITPESSWPYYGSPITNYESTGLAKLTTYKQLASLADVYGALSRNHPVVVGLDVNYYWNAIGADGNIRVGGGSQGGHAIEVVEYKDDPAWGGGGFFTIKNSWGSKWGDRGYAHIPFQYCDYYDCYFLEMEGVTYEGKAPPTPPPPSTPDAGPPPSPPDAGPTPPPPDGTLPEATAYDIDCVAEFSTTSPNYYKVKLVGAKDARYLEQVASVTYDLDASYGRWQYWNQTDPKGGFITPYWYSTFSHHWRTNGAKVTLKSGKILYLAGAPIDW